MISKLVVLKYEICDLLWELHKFTVSTPVFSENIRSTVVLNRVPVLQYLWSTASHAYECAAMLDPVFYRNTLPFQQA
jgi:hypothetical protein